MQNYSAVDVIDDGAAITLHRHGGESLRFHAVWLRDNLLDAETRDPGNGQRLITLGEIPGDVSLESATLNDSHELSLVFAPDGKKASFPISWLEVHAYDTASPSLPGWLPSGIELWDRGLEESVPSASFAEASTNDHSLLSWLKTVERFGFAKMTDGPLESGALLKVAGLFGYVRETNYGRFFEVRTEVNPANLAYTGLGLQAHTDNPYRNPVPTLQILYCLENSADGGESQVIDGFKVATRLRGEDPAGFELLAKFCVQFEFAGTSGVKLRSRCSIIELAADGELIAVRFNNRSAAPFTDIPYDRMAEFYQAYRRFAEIVDDPEMAVTFKLEPGECFVVDNTRVLHGRIGYSGNGTRWLQGCYPDKDGLLSKLAVLEDAQRDRGL